MEKNLEQFESEENLKNRAYMLGLKLKNSGLEEEVIYARLEKQGIPESLAKEVASEIMNEKIKLIKEQEKPFENVALIKIGGGILLAVISSIVLPGQIILPIGLVLGGIAYFLITKK
jgi:hypothetical protein